jgi:hypothetical protein
MSQIANLKHDLQNCLREINSAQLVLVSTAPSDESIDPSRHWFDVTKDRLTDELKVVQAHHSALTASLQTGCDYFTLIRSVRALHQSIEVTRESVDYFFDQAQINAKDAIAALEPAVPPRT